MSLDALMGKSWEELDAAKFDSMGIQQNFTHALEHFDNAKRLHINSVVLGWRATVLEKMGLIEQSLVEANEAKLLLDPNGAVDIDNDDNQYAQKLFSERLDVQIPLPTKAYVASLISRLEYRVRICACNEVIRLAGIALADRGLEVESPGDRGNDSNPTPGSFVPVAEYILADARELRQLSAAYCERAISSFCLAESGFGGVHEKYSAWCDVQQTEVLDGMFCQIADDPDDWDDDDDDFDDAPSKPAAASKAAPKAATPPKVVMPAPGYKEGQPGFLLPAGIVLTKVAAGGAGPGAEIGVTNVRGFIPGAAIIVSMDEGAEEEVTILEARPAADGKAGTLVVTPALSFKHPAGKTVAQERAALVSC